MLEARIALDRASTRRMDQDGHLHVEMTNLSKANVCPYLGKEIPDHETLGLDANKVYMLLRDPGELAKAASSLNGKPLLDYHIPATSDDHPTDRVVGSIGNDVTFDGKYLKGSLSVWVGDSITRIESGAQRELSCGYRYRADMTPGVFEGVAFHGVMRDIAFNHTALVEQGRAGPDVLVSDSRLEMSAMINSRRALMASGAVFMALRPKLAADAKLSLDEAFDGINAENFTDKRDEIASAVVEIATPLLAQDAALSADDILLALDAAAAADDDEDDAMASDEEEDDIKAKMKPKAKKKMAGDVAPKKDEPIALDAAAIRAEVRAEQAALRDAERAVRPHIGELSVVPETPDGIFKLALDAAVIDGRLDKAVLSGADAKSYKTMLAMLPLPGAKGSEPIAMDERTAADSWFDSEILGRSAK